MAASLKRSRQKVDYRQLNSFSSTVLYDTVPTGRNSRFYEVVRIIKRRKTSQGYEYLIKWKRWPFYSCSWEPSENLTLPLLRSYDQPQKPDGPRLGRACRDFLLGIQSALKAKSHGPVYVNMDLDAWQYITHNKGIECEHQGYILYEKNDFAFLGLPDDGLYTLNEHGEGMAIDFPIKAKPIVSWSHSRFTVRNGKLVKSPRVPLEKIVIVFVKRACDIDNVL